MVLRDSKEASEREHNKGGEEELERSSEVTVKVGCYTVSGLVGH